MRTLFIFLGAGLVASAFAAERDADRVRKHLQSDNYTVTWGPARVVDGSAELDVGDGSGHGFNLAWLRFRPGQGQVDVLSIQLSEGRQPYQSKWLPDTAPVTVQRARMKPDDYATLLHDLAVVNAAKLAPVRRRTTTMSSYDFWVSARVTASRRTVADLDWAGYWASDSEVDFARPQAAVAFARAAVKELDFREHALTEEERAWASARFALDWKRCKDSRDHWQSGRCR
jgi:hypothetical protein